MKELTNMLKNILKELKNLHEAELTDEEREAAEENGEAYDLYSYFADVLDFEYTVDSRKEYSSVKVWLTLGGPNIWIDTSEREIRGAWGSSRESVYLPYEICEEIDSIFEEYYNC